MSPCKSRHTCHSHPFGLRADTLGHDDSVVFNQPERRSIMVDILHRVGIKASVDQVYKALTTRAGLAGWWTTDTQGDSKVGGILKFRFTRDGKELGGFDMKVLELQPGRRVLWQVVEGPAEWVGTKIGF